MFPTQTMWLFDLDNTLHRADAGIFQLINRAMTAFLAQRLHLDEQSASDLRQQYWHQYGATLAGLQRHHPEIDVMDFLRASHPLPEVGRLIQAEDGIRTTLARLPVAKAVFSNGPSFYVRHILHTLEINDCFQAAFGIDDLGLASKPEPLAYQRVCTQLGHTPAQCVLIDDSAANLKTAKALGMGTIWFDRHAHKLPFVDACADTLSQLAQWLPQNHPV